jgi:hypothetical protein
MAAILHTTHGFVKEQYRQNAWRLQNQKTGSLVFGGAAHFSPQRSRSPQRKTLMRISRKGQKARIFRDVRRIQVFRVKPFPLVSGLPSDFAKTMSPNKNGMFVRTSRFQNFDAPPVPCAAGF